MRCGIIAPWALNGAGRLRQDDAHLKCAVSTNNLCPGVRFDDGYGVGNLICTRSHIFYSRFTRKVTQKHRMDVLHVPVFSKDHNLRQDIALTFQDWHISSWSTRDIPKASMMMMVSVPEYPGLRGTLRWVFEIKHFQKTKNPM